MMINLDDAILEAFPDARPEYRKTIRWRYLYLYGVPIDEAIKAVRRGYSTPGSAMAAHVIERRIPNIAAHEYYEFA